jgi:hypothetical protein
LILNQSEIEMGGKSSKSKQPKQEKIVQVGKNERRDERLANEAGIYGQPQQGYIQHQAYLPPQQQIYYEQPQFIAPQQQLLQQPQAHFLPQPQAQFLPPQQILLPPQQILGPPQQIVGPYAPRRHHHRRHHQPQQQQPQVAGLAPNEVENLKREFQAAAGIDQKLDLLEFVALYSRMHPHPQTQTPQFQYLASSAFSAMDTNHSGRININEFIGAYSRLRQQAV